MVDFASKTDVEEAYDGDLPSISSRLAYQLEVVNARLRLLMPSLGERVAGNADLATLARDVVVQAVIRRLGPTDDRAVRSVSQGVGPFSTTLTYERDRAGIFPDDDLALLGEQGGGDYAGIGTIRLGRVDWAAQ